MSLFSDVSGIYAELKGSRAERIRTNDLLGELRDIAKTQTEHLLTIADALTQGPEEAEATDLGLTAGQPVEQP